MLTNELQSLADPIRAKHLQRYFKTGKGEYAEGDKFLGLTVPMQRKLAGKYRDLKLRELTKLLASKIHEYRFTALLILVSRYERAAEQEKHKIVNFYLKQTKHINNWDLVDTSAPYILGDWLADKNRLSKDRFLLCDLAHSNNLWNRRIAVVSTAALIRAGQFGVTLSLAKQLLIDDHDLIHKAVGWMLREVGKKSSSDLKKFLDRYSRKMPRTMLRYALEKFPKSERQRYLEK